MQFPVPQFTDVEDKIIGPLTVKQFGIIFGIGTIVFLGFSLTKSLVVSAVLFVIVGLPGLGLAMVPFNGRPMYASIGKLIQFFTSPKVFVFHKEINSSFKSNFKDAQVKSERNEQSVAPEDAQARLKQLESLLSKTASAERETAGKIR